ncbi:hypothetical protein ACKXF4_08475 [Faecalibacterium prausnitzii]|uniref:hypothetical protein n=1 Tax=Faecalibacterium prausnitzii TaxID=853 RepID=UPI003AACAA2D
MLQKYGVQVYLEPGEAWALNAGYLVTTVLDTLRNGDTSLAILEMSASVPHAGRHRDALPPAAAGRRRGRGEGAHRPAGRPHLPCGGCHRGLQL